MVPSDRIQALRANIEKAFVGKGDAVRMALVALLSGGHVLIEDVPGVGKTTLAKALARSISCTFRRIQFTPDLLPSDLLGVSVYSQQTGEFLFKPGPIFSNVVLADEINRTNPRTQSALLEAMSDVQVSTDGVTRPIEPPFIVLATQNPYEFEGTYPLPESQLDRFLMRLSIGYPDSASEREVLRSQEVDHPLDALAPVVTGAEVLEMQRAVKAVKVSDDILDYILEVVQRTRETDRLAVGVSPRGSLCLRRAVQALSLVEGRDYALPDDAKRLARPVLAHRVILRGGGSTREAAERVIDDLLDLVPAPG